MSPRILAATLLTAAAVNSIAKTARADIYDVYVNSSNTLHVEGSNYGDEIEVVEENFRSVRVTWGTSRSDTRTGYVNVIDVRVLITDKQYDYNPLVDKTFTRIVNMTAKIPASAIAVYVGTTYRIDDVEIFARSGDDDVHNATDLPSVIFGGSGADFIQGGGSVDVIDGGRDSDVLKGGNGNDVLISGPSAKNGHVHTNYMYGESGADTYVYNNADFIDDDNFSGLGWSISPDYIETSGSLQGMNHIEE